MSSRFTHTRTTQAPVDGINMASITAEVQARAKARAAKAANTPATDAEIGQARADDRARREEIEYAEMAERRAEREAAQEARREAGNTIEGARAAAARIRL